MKKNCRKIRLMVMDVDGTLTDGHIYIGANGEVMKAFNVKDGYGIVQMKKRGITPAIITGRSSPIVAARAAELGIEHLYQGVSDKLAQLQALTAQLGLTMENVAYIGDDLNDLECIRACTAMGVSACPADAVPQVRLAADFVCTVPGGYGAVREFTEYIAGNL